MIYLEEGDWCVLHAVSFTIYDEAGALVEGVRSGQKPLEDGAILCANNQVFAALAKVIRSTD